jgi:hypothetical protein
MSTRDQKLESLGFPLDKIKYAPPGQGALIESLAIDRDTM